MVGCKGKFSRQVGTPNFGTAFDACDHMQLYVYTVVWYCTGVHCRPTRRRQSVTRVTLLSAGEQPGRGERQRRVRPGGVLSARDPGGAPLDGPAMPEVTKNPAAAGSASSKKKQDDALTELAKQIEKKETKAEKKRIAAAKAKADGVPSRWVANLLELSL